MIHDAWSSFDTGIRRSTMTSGSTVATTVWSSAVKKTASATSPTVDQRAAGLPVLPLSWRNGTSCSVACMCAESRRRPGQTNRGTLRWHGARGPGEGSRFEWSGWSDSNRRPLAPHASALPGCATPRPAVEYHRPNRHSSSAAPGEPGTNRPGGWACSQSMGCTGRWA